MEFTSRKVDVVEGLEKTSDSLISMYEVPPEQEVSLDEFEIFALQRLQLLRGISDLKTKVAEERDRMQPIKLLEQKLFPKDADRARRDHISHFILRLAYCRTADLRSWFLDQEYTLFKYRLESLSHNAYELQKFMKDNGITFDKISESEKREREQYLKFGDTSLNQDFFKISFEKALRLVKNRLVYIEGGFAYVPFKSIVDLITSEFRMKLSKALSEASQFVDSLGVDSRIGPLIKNMSTQYVGRDYSKTSEGVDKLSPEKVDQAADMHMPLCMKMLQDTMRKEHKLKHWARLQYGLFLKSAGLGMEDALLFWESHFTKVMTREQFMKDYSYNFRHMYGKEGSRKNYTPFSCTKIILGPPPAPGTVHGCPYRHSGESQVRSMLSSLKINTHDIDEIMGLAKGNHYQLACQKHFDVTHPDALSMDLNMTESVANHPNAWFEASTKYHRIKSAKGGSGQSKAASSSAMPASSSVNTAASQSEPVSGEAMDTEP